MLLWWDMWRLYAALVLSTYPVFTYAAGFVPCGGTGEAPCQLCHVVELVNLLLGWLSGILTLVVVLIIIASGLMMVTSLGNASTKEKAKKMIATSLVGWAIILSAWMFVEFGFKALLGDNPLGFWSNLSCVAQPSPIQWARTTASGDNAQVLPPADVSSRVAAISSSGSLQTDIANAARAAGITNPEQVDVMRALISQESSNCSNKIGPVTSTGVAYGCGQMLVSTARTLDSNLSGLSDAAVAQKLKDDNTYNLALSAKYYKQLLTKYNDNTDLALAAYNGGPGANASSLDCPGLKKWQCVWDSPGCYGTSKSDCKKNEGPASYAQTRHYVTNINAIADSL